MMILIYKRNNKIYNKINRIKKSIMNKDNNYYNKYLITIYNKK